MNNWATSKARSPRVSQNEPSTRWHSGCPRGLPSAHGEPGMQQPLCFSGTRKKWKLQCLLQPQTHTDFYVFRLVFPLGLGLCWSFWPPVSLAAALQHFSEYSGRRNANIFLEAMQWSVQLEHPSPSQQSWLQFYFSSSNIVQQSCDSIKPVTPYPGAATAARALGARQAVRVNRCFCWVTGWPRWRGRAHVQLLWL